MRRIPDNKHCCSIACSGYDDTKTNTQQKTSNLFSLKFGFGRRGWSQWIRIEMPSSHVVFMHVFVGG